MGWRQRHPRLEMGAVRKDFTDCIQSFSSGTNTLAKNHVLRRLRWLDKKPLAHLATLAYVAIRHGYHLGYFLLFGLEFGCVHAQQQLYKLIDRTPGWAELIAKPYAQPFIQLFGHLVTAYRMGFAFVTMGLMRTIYRIGPVKSMYFLIYILYFAVWPTLHHLLRSDITKEAEK